MKGATGKASFFSLSDWWKYSSSRQSTHPSDTWSKDSNAELCFLLTFLVFICTAFYHDWTTFVGNVAGFYQDHLQGIEVILKSWKIDTFIQNIFISNCCHHVPPRCYSQSCQASAWSCRGSPRVAPCLSPGWELSCLLAPGRPLWARDVPLLQICIFFNIVQKGGGVKPMLKNYRFRNGILT